MNRRGFVTGVGTVAAAGAAAQALRGPGSGSVLADGLTATRKAVTAGRFDANSRPAGTSTLDPSASGSGVTLGYIPASADFVKANSPPVEQLTLRNFWRLVSLRSVVGILGYVPSAAPTIERIEVTVNFALAEPPYVAPFYAWQYVNVAGQPAKSSSPLKFTTSVPDDATITVSFKVKSAVTGIAAGSLTYPIGGAGLGPGIYALAGPSPATGGAPDWNRLTWGDSAGTLAHLDGRAIDFDYVTLVLSPAQSV